MNTDMKKQRAVDYFYSQLTVIPFIKKMEMKGIFIPFEKYHDILEKAEAMEKDQIVEAYSNGWHDGQDVILQQVKHIDKGGDDAGQKLYNETYGGDK
jgi:hypothetical protein